ncbi:addiction module antidote protein [Ferrovibrio sp.]|uniref:addiction module antidote protein n=1 Tax=Ferrovibrio sp. TaxID=1917215 RepID=UPI001B4F98B3|nr:addiction module antidote protein [Ferrovibrio sp.]MBP7064591.1 putative addiction module antidote protein [Ferrovibrio sp.]
MVKTVPFDAAKYLTEPEDQIAFLEEAFESGDPKFVAHALGIIARARGISSVAQETGLSREALYRSLSSEGNPTITTVMDVMRALGLKLSPHKAAA